MISYVLYTIIHASIDQSVFLLIAMLRFLSPRVLKSCSVLPHSVFTSNPAYLVDYRDSAQPPPMLFQGSLILLESVYWFNPSGYLIFMSISLHFHQVVMLNRKPIKDLHLSWQKPLCQFHYILYHNFGGKEEEFNGWPGLLIQEETFIRFVPSS